MPAPAQHEQILYDWAQTMSDGSIVKKGSEGIAIRGTFIREFFIEILSYVPSGGGARHIIHGTNAHNVLIKLVFLIILATGALWGSAHAEEQLSLSASLVSPDAGLAPGVRDSLKTEFISNEDTNNATLWQRLRGDFKLEDLDSPLIEKHTQWYASRPDYVARMMTRANRYLYYITSEVERRGMPGEIALLPMIESAFNPGAYSTSNAAGIWQFIPSTGRNFGMQQNWWYDGRRDIIGATTGALDYLEKLHHKFGDWELALAAYNWGEGAVQRAQERNRKLGLPVNYASLTMPDETRNYLPKLFAIKNIVSNPARFGLELPDIANEPYFASIASTKRIDVELAAQLADISKEEFIALNPAHNRPVILQRNSDFILLPINKVEAFRANLQNYDKPLVSWQIYKTKKGERLEHLAPRFGLSVERLKSVNGLSAKGGVSKGETLLVPLNGESSEDEDTLEAFNMHLHPVTTKIRDSDTASLKYIARSGDTLDKLARRYHVSITSLRSWNGHVKHIKAGQMLTIGQAKSNNKVVRSNDKRNPVKNNGKSVVATKYVKSSNHAKIARHTKALSHSKTVPGKIVKHPSGSKNTRLTPHKK